MRIPTSAPNCRVYGRDARCPLNVDSRRRRNVSNAQRAVIAVASKIGTRSLVATPGLDLWLRAPDQVRPGCRVVTSWTIHALPSGSLKAKKDP
jgi:hypothetical protein